MSDALRRSPCTADLCSVAGTGAAGVSMAVAAGPFTCAEDCAFAPLEALLAWAATAQPDVLLLLGPFVDAEHPAVAGGLLPETFEELFMEQVRCAQRCCVLWSRCVLCGNGNLLGVCAAGYAVGPFLKCGAPGRRKQAAPGDL